jgi:hypothetical protein
MSFQSSSVSTYTGRAVSSFGTVTGQDRGTGRLEVYKSQAGTKSHSFSFDFESTLDIYTAKNLI